MKTIKVYQAKALIDQHNIDNLIYVDRVSDEDDDDFPEIIFKSDLNNQSYSLYHCESDYPDLGTTIDTVQKFDAFLDDDNNKNLDVEVAPVKKIPVTTYKYVGDDSND